MSNGATIEAAVEALDRQEGDRSSRLAPPRRLFIGSTAARILRVLQMPIIVTPGEEEST
jgi:nucleotide-binding universal stress UspA family protein